MALFKSFVSKQSSRLYHAFTHGRPFKRVKRPQDQALLQKIVNRLSRAAGHGDYHAPVAIVTFPIKKDMVNALTLPGGQMLVFVGLLDSCRREAARMAGEKTKLNLRLGTKKAELYHYERLLTAIMGHELGHYFGRHFMRLYAFKSKNFSQASSGISLKRIRYGQTHELEADNFSLHLLQRLGYDAIYLVRVLQLLKRERQKMVARGINVNPYLTTHPTGNDRLAAVSTKAQGKDFFLRMARLEQAFAAIETGSHLEQAAETLSLELKKFPRNTHLLTAAAKIGHRRWEQSCSLKELLFKASIASATFRDNMIRVKSRSLWSASAETKSSIPCKVEYFNQAEAFYRRALKEHADYLTQSSFAALLVYNRKKRNEAVNLAEEAVKNIPKSRSSLVNKIQALNNLGIVYFFTGDKQNAEKSFQRAAGFNRGIILTTANFRIMGRKKRRRRHRLLQEFSARNMGKLFEAFFNLGQLYYKSGHEKKARGIWVNYIKYLDWSSEWAKYAARKVNIDLKNIKPGPVPTMAGVGPGTSMPVLIRLWGKPDHESSFLNITRWEYKSKGAMIMLNGGFVKAIRANDKLAPRLSNGLYINMKRALVEKKMGPPPVRRGKRVRYPRSYLFLAYDNDKLSEIVIAR